MRLEQMLAYLDGRLPEADRATIESYLATAEGRQARQALATLQQAVRGSSAPAAVPCDKLEEICALVDGDLPAAERPALEAHLLACSNCLQTFGDLQMAVPAGSLTVPQEVLDRVRDPVEKIIPFPAAAPGTGRRRPYLWRGGMLGTVVAAMLFVVLGRPMLQRGYQLPAGPGAPATTAGRAVTTGIADERGGLSPGTFREADKGSGTAEQRINALLQDLQADPTNLAARQALARLYEQLGKRALAVKHYHLLEEALLQRHMEGGKEYTETRQRLQALAP